MQSACVMSEKKTQLVTWVLLFLVPVTGMSVDLIAPSLPAITVALSASAAAVKGMISIYLLGYALGNFLTGFMSDGLGRRNILRLVLLGFAVASLLPVIVPHIEILLFSRLMQGLFMGASAVVIRSIFADILPADRLLRMGTMLGTMWGVGPVIGPIVGSYLQVHMGWQANFSLFALLTFIEFLIVFFIVPETLRVRQPLSFASLKHNFMEVISNRFFVALSVMMGIVYSLIISFNTMGPFLIEEQFGYTPIFFGRLALGLGAMFLGATFICRYLIKANTFKRLVFIVTHFALFVAMTGLFITFSESQSVVLITLVSAVMYFTCGFIFPLSMGRGMSMFRHMAGTASATMYFINVLLTSSINFLVSFIHAETMQSLFMIYLGLMLGCIFIYWIIIHPCEAKKQNG